MKSHLFRAAIEKDQFEAGRQAYHAWCPALLGCHTWGPTKEEALANVREAIELYLEDLVEAGDVLEGKRTYRDESAFI